MLATQTAAATEDIRAQVTEIQESTRQAVDNAGQVSRNVHQAASGTHTVSRNAATDLARLAETLRASMETFRL